MSRFNVFLHRTGDRIGLPTATRSLILVEIAADLEDLFQHYLHQGMSEEEAASRAEEKVDMSDEVLLELVRIHSDARGWAERIVQRAQPFWERIAMAMIVLFLVVISSIEANWNPMRHTAIFIWPVLAIFVALVTFFVVQLVRMSNGPSPRRLRESLATPIFLGTASVVVGFVGFGIDMYQTLMRMSANPEQAAPLFARVLLEGTSTLMVALIVALVGAIVWFILAGRVARIEDEAARSFMEVN
jgi:hypothetical protein